MIKILKKVEETMRTPKGIEVYYCNKAGTISRMNEALLYELTGGEKKGICPRCDMYWILNLDHIVPQLVLHSLGLKPEHYYIKENMELMCTRCNTTKSHYMETTNKKGLYILKELIGMIEKRANENKDTRRPRT